MDIPSRSIYSVLFGPVTYLVRLVITGETPASHKSLLLLAAITVILLLNHTVVIPEFLSVQEVYLLLLFDFGLVVSYTMQGVTITQIKNR